MESDSTESFKEKAFFWRGIAAGFLAGIGVAAALRYTPFEKFISGVSTVEGKPDTKLAALEDTLTHKTAAFDSRRDHAESAGDPRTLASDRTGTAAEFVRRGGAPGGRTEAEVLEVPGHPGERIDHLDLSQPDRKFRRSFDMGSAG
jgi:hypothetical protein